MRPGFAWLLGAVLLPGCALLGKGELRVPRTFTPEYEGAAAAPAGQPGPRLRLGRVEGGAHLRERPVTRGAGGEVRYAEGWRWTERPEVYLRQALARALFEERGLTEVHAGRGVTLEVELLAFEEVDEPHAARLRARLVLRDDRVSLLVDTVTVDEPIPPGGPADRAPAVVAALSRALRAGVDHLADLATARLAEQPAPGPGAGPGAAPP